MEVELAAQAAEILLRTPGPAADEEGAWQTLSAVTPRHSSTPNSNAELALPRSSRACHDTRCESLVPAARVVTPRGAATVSSRQAVARHDLPVAGDPARARSPGMTRHGFANRRD